MKNFIAVGVIFLLVILVSNSLFVVKETERAVMLQFGELVQDSIDPGLHVKIPWVNNVRKFDARILTEDAPRRRYLTLEQKALEVDSYAKWRIVDVGQFYISTRGNTTTAGSLLAERINDGLRDQIGDRTLAEVVAGERDQMMLALTANLNETTAADLGIEIIDVRVKRIDLPEDVRSSVYERMITERNVLSVKSSRLVFVPMLIVRRQSFVQRLTEMLNNCEVRVTQQPRQSTQRPTTKTLSSMRLPAA
jgi:modulator of FtsH protease HflC